ncbi:MAG: DUF296 domain-containing protein [Clostridia bacterium]|nr:DUF296 domain-containing protein [Clostridia bacterium]
MDYRKFGETFYVRMDKGDEIISSLLGVCKRENIESAIFSGIGGCGSAEIQTYEPENGSYETRELHGMLELVSINGGIVKDGEGALCQHTHAMFAFKEGEAHCTAGGHLKSATVLITAEIELRPVVGGRITRRINPETGTGYWDLGD